MSEEKLPATVKGLAAVSFFNDVASEMVYPLLPAFVTVTLGAGATVLGALDGAAELTSALLKWVSGRVSDRKGWRKPLILAGYATAVLVRPMIAVANAAWEVVGFRVIDRVGKGLRTAPRDAMLAESTPAGMHGRAFGFHRGADHLGAMLGSLAAWWALERHAEVRQVIGWSAVPGIVAVIVLAVVVKGQGRIEAEDGKREGENAHPGNREMRVLSFSHSFNVQILLLALFAACRLPEALMLLRMQDLGVPVAMIPLVWAGLHVVRSAMSYPMGKLNDRFGSQVMIGAGALWFALALCLMGKALSPGAAVAVFLGFGLFAPLTEPAERALVAKLSPASLGKGFGVYHALTGFAALPAGLAFGWLYQSSGGNDACWLSGALVGGVGVVWMFRRTSLPGGVGSAAVMLAILTGCRSSGHDRPEDARIVTEDVSRFAAVLEPALVADSGRAVRMLDSAYHVPGSIGLQDWWGSRVDNAQRLVAAVRASPDRYRRVSAEVLAPGVPDSLRAELLRVYRELKRRYPGAVFPDVYLLLGRGNSGGTTSGAGLLIGLEVALRDSSKGPDDLVPIIAHELIHFQQPWQFGHVSLLDGAFREGSADFIAELVAGRTINARQREFGLAHEAELWREFRGRMGGKDYTGWLYGGAPKGRPQDLGYFIGYRIAQAYYGRATNKDAALRELLTARHGAPILAASGYNPR